MFVETLLQRLVAGFRDGGWAYGYRPRDRAAEPTALGALALHAHDHAPDVAQAAARWLAQVQADDGGVPVSDRVPNPRWPTALALLAWTRLAPESAELDDARGRAVGYLLRHHGTSLPRSPLFGHDTMLVGWSWVDDTHSWVEPTGYAVAALRAAGRADHPRVREGVRLLLDRCLPDGGWNYGNTRVMHNVLRPFPATTGVALAALAGEPRADEVDRSLAYLREVAPTLRAPVSLGWAVLGLRAWGEAPREALEWLERCALEPGRRPPDPLHDALLLLAASERPLVGEPPTREGDGV